MLTIDDVPPQEQWVVIDWLVTQALKDGNGFAATWLSKQLRKLEQDNL